MLAVLLWGGVLSAVEGDPERDFRTVSARFVETLDAVEAQAGYLRLTESHPDFAPPYYNLARLAESSQRWDEALAWYRAYLERAPTGTWSALAGGRVPELERLAAAGPEERLRREYETALGRAKAAIDAGSWGAALAELEQAAELDPTAWEAPALSGWILLRQGDFAAAEEPLALALERAAPDRRVAIAEALTLCRDQLRLAEFEREARAELAAGAYARAAAAYDRAAGLDPDRADLALAAAEAWVLHGDHATAARRYRALERHADPAVQARVERGLARLAPYLAAPESAEQEAFGELRGGDRYLVGARALRMGEYEVAERELDAAIAAITPRPQHARFYLDRARLRHRRGDGQAAMHDLAQALRIDDGLGEAYRLRGELLAAEGDHVRARADFALAIDSGLQGEELAAAYAGRAGATMAGGDFAAAHADWSRALELQRFPDWLRRRALCADRIDRRGDAVADLRAAAVLAPDDGEIRRLIDELSSQWHVFLSPQEGYKRHRLLLSEAWPRESITAGWNDGLAITHLAAHGGRWSVGMAQIPSRGMETWSVDAELPLDVIANKRGEGYYITHVAYNAGTGRWAVTMNQDPSFSAQQFQREAEWPADWIKERWDEGMHITAVAQGAGTWVVVMSRVEGLGWQGYSFGDEVPVAWLREQAGQSRNLDHLVPIEGGRWLAVATARRGAGRQAMLEARTFPLQRCEELAAADHVITAVGFTRYED